MADEVTKEEVAPYLPEANSVTVFSAPWCGYCTRLKAALKRESIPFREVQIEEDATAERIAIAVNGGSWVIPTVLYADGTGQVNPNVQQVKEQLAALA